jgi:ubiquitin carboxyl-terminal hydrolase 7
MHYCCCAALSSRRFRGVAALHQMLQHAGHATDTLYYEVLDMPLPQLEQLKSLRVSRATPPVAAC